MDENKLNFFESIDELLTRVPYKIYMGLACVALLVTLVTVVDYVNQKKEVAQQEQFKEWSSNLIEYSFEDDSNFRTPVSEPSKHSITKEEYNQVFKDYRDGKITQQQASDIIKNSKVEVRE